jgi:hypothetical protein
MPSGSKKSGFIPKSSSGWRWRHSELGGAAPGRRFGVELAHPVQAELSALY